MVDVGYLQSIADKSLVSGRKAGHKTDEMNHFPRVTVERQEPPSVAGGVLLFWYFPTGVCIVSLASCFLHVAFGIDGWQKQTEYHTVTIRLRFLELYKAYPTYVCPGETGQDLDLPAVLRAEILHFLHDRSRRSATQKQRVRPDVRSGSTTRHSSVPCITSKPDHTGGEH